MTPQDVEAYVAQLAAYGLHYLEGGKAKDLVVVDQLRGPAAPCDWIEFGHVNLNDHPHERVAACRLAGSTDNTLVRPDGWKFENSLSQSFGFVPTQHTDKSLTFLRREDGLDVYQSKITGREVYVGRTTRNEQS